VSTAPIIITTLGVSGNSGSLYNYTVEASGYPSADFSLITAPAGMVIHPQTGKLIWTPGLTGSFDVTVEAQNVFGTNTQSFTIEVN